MSHLINNIDQLQEHINVPGSFDFDSFAPYVERAERKYIIDLIGKSTFDVILASTADNMVLVKKLLTESTAHFAMFMAVPILGIKISNAGLLATNNEQSKQPEWWQVRDLLRSLQKTAYEALDEALKEMEANPTIFSTWVSSTQYTIFKQLLVNETSIFNQWFFIGNSRRTFLALKPYLHEVEEQFLVSILGDATLTQLKETSTNLIVKRVKDIIQKACVALTIAKVAEVTTFDITDSGLFYKWESLPGEKAVPVDTEALERLRKMKQNAGEEYLKSAIKLIELSPSLFTHYVAKETSSTSRIIKNKSGLYL